jgi:hypothetical protein
MSLIETFSFGQHIGALILFVVFLVIEFSLRRLKKNKRKEYDLKKPAMESLEQIEDLSLEHYKELQQIDVMRLIILFIGIVTILAVYNVQIFNVLAVATGALILALRDSFTSFFAYFYILSNFKLGDDIRINNALGEIVGIKPFYTALAGKDDNGEYNSKLNYIPNFMFFNQTIERQQLKSDDYRKLSLQILYTNTAFADGLEIWLDKIEIYLDKLLPKRAMTKVGHFRGYAGVRYKMNFDYNDKGEVVVKISFITRSFRVLEQRADQENAPVSRT